MNANTPTSPPSALDRHRELAAQLSSVREQLAPDPFEPGALSQLCIDCGVLFWRWKRRPRPRCASCAARHQVEVAEQLAARDGPAYVQLVESQLRHWSSERRRLRQLARERADQA